MHEYKTVHLVCLASSRATCTYKKVSRRDVGSRRREPFHPTDFLAMLCNLKSCTNRNYDDADKAAEELLALCT